jgi:nicotinate-nucleotide pyrophosphorylase (carboxylating)
MRNVWQEPQPFGWEDHVRAALSEDVYSGDITSSAIPTGRLVNWYIEAQATGIVCGVGIVAYLFGEDTECLVSDGAQVTPGTVVAKGSLEGNHALQVERTALNYLMMLSGVSTLTNSFVKTVEGTGAKIVDTRKTVPLMRHLQKYAVRCGGGHNHRMGLYDAVMIKDNHIRAHGSITAAVEATRHKISHLYKIEIECDHPEQVAEAVNAGADVILLDNMLPAVMAEVVQEFQGKAVFEASGGVALSTVRAIAESGVNVISVGALTHSAPSLAFHLELSQG